jgi:hypothetical protein
MSKRILKFIAFFAFMGFCFNNVRIVISQNGKISSDVTLSNIESATAACESFPSGDNGDCISTPEGGFCDNSWLFHDCKN